MRTAIAPCVLGVLFAGTSLSPLPRAKAETFPFPLPALDSTTTAIDVSTLNSGPIDDSRRISVKGGHFTAADGKRVRLLGVNFSFGANFPTHGDAEAVAAHLAKFGINAVRHHHMDRRDIWRRHPDGTREVDPEKLERLAYLITQLGRHGIYSDINIHVSRTFTEKEGFPEAEKLGRYNKYTHYFVPRMRELWKDYARILLTYKNPHSGRRLADEPSLAMVEITNENRFSPVGFGPLVDVPERYKAPLRKRWNAWLKERYRSTEALRKAWGDVSQPLGKDIADFGDFANGHKPWLLFDHGKSRAEVKLRSSGPEGHRAIEIEIDRTTGQEWHLEFGRHNLSVRKGQIYTVSFWIRADEPREVHVDVSRGESPWDRIGFGRKIQVDRKWRHHSYAFRAEDTLKGKARWIFKIGKHRADVWLADLHLRTGGELHSIGRNASLEAGTIALPITPHSIACRDDIRAFLFEVERDFFKDTGRYLKDELKIRPPIAGTQVGYVDLRAIAVLDYIDAHAYWQHPRWTGRAWSATGWRIGNTPTVRDRAGGSLPHLAKGRVIGMPFTVSEYNQPAPNEYQAEFVPSFAILGALQDWDGIFLYSFQHGNERWRAQKIQGFFDVNGNPLVMGLLPAAAMMYRRGDVAPAQELLAMRLGDHLPAWMAWQHRIGVDLSEGPAERPSRSHASPPEPVVSDTGQFTWHHDNDDTARYLLSAPRSALALGFIASSEIDLGDVSIRTGATSKGFGAIAVTSLDGRPFPESERVLVTTIAHAANTGMRWNEQRNSVENHWGISPPRVEIQPATVGIRCKASTGFVLDASGKRIKTAKVVREGPMLNVSLDPKDQTIWYELASPD